MTIYSQYGILLNGVSAAASQTSNPIVVDMMNQVILDFDFTGTFTGVLAIESATSGNDRPMDLIKGPKASSIRWKQIKTLTITNGVTPAPDSNAFWWSEILTSANLLRVSYTFGSGTGVINCNFVGKSYG
jgi:hypothetical protein